MSSDKCKLVYSFLYWIHWYCLVCGRFVLLIDENRVETNAATTTQKNANNKYFDSCTYGEVSKNTMSFNLKRQSTLNAVQFAVSAWWTSVCVCVYTINTHI